MAVGSLSVFSKAFFLFVRYWYKYVIHFNSILFSIPMNDLLMRRREEDLNFDLKYVLFSAQFNCFSRDSIKVALIALLNNLNVIKQDNEARQLMIMSAVVVQLYQ